MHIGFAMCGSFCTFSKVFPIIELLTRDYQVTAILSDSAYRTSTRFGTADEHIRTITELCGKPPIHTLTEAEPIGPKKLFDAIIVAPCTGNTLGKIANGITDGPVSMAVKSHLRNGRPVILGISTNDALSGSAENIGRLLARKHIFFIPFGQDDPRQKPTSMVADFTKIPLALEEALSGRQIQPLIL